MVNIDLTYVYIVLTLRTSIYSQETGPENKINHKDYVPTVLRQNTE
jgi:hypothetical protein